MNIRQSNQRFILTVNGDEAFEILRALESHKRKLGRLVAKNTDDPSLRVVYNHVEHMISELSAKGGDEFRRSSKPYKIKGE